MENGRGCIGVNALALIFGLRLDKYAKMLLSVRPQVEFRARNRVVRVVGIQDGTSQAVTFHSL